MAATPLEIIVSGDTSEADRALTSLQTNVVKSSASFEQLRNELSKFRTAASATLNPDLLNVYNAKIDELTSQMDQLSLESQNNTSKFSEMTVAVNNVSAGTQRFQAAITRATDPVSIAAREVNNLSRRLLYLGSSFIIADLVGPAISAIKDLINPIQQLTEKEQLLKDVNDNAAKGAAAQVTAVDVLKNKLNDLTKPMSDRLQLAKDYNKIADEGNKIDLTQLNNLTSINDQIDKQIGLIGRQALAKAAESKIAEFAEKAIDAQFAFTHALEISGLTEDQVSKSINARMQQTADVAKKTTQTLDVFNSQQQIKIKPIVPEDAINQVQLVDKKLEVLLLAKKNAAFLLDQTIKTLRPDISDDALTPKPTKGKDTAYEDALKAAQAYYQKVQLFAKETYGANLSDAEKNTTDINSFLIQAEINFLEKKLDLEKKFNKDVFDTQKELFAAQDKLRENNFDFSRGQNKDSVFQPLGSSKQLADTKELIDSVEKLAKLKIDPKGLAPIVPTPELQKAIEALQKFLQQEQAIAELTQKTLTPAFDTLFTDIVDGSNKAFRDFEKAFTNAIKQMIAQLLSFAAVAGIISLLPGTAEFGTIFNKLAGIKLFASGVKNFGGGPAIVGEQGPELVNLPMGASVTPNNILQGLSSSPQVFIPGITIKGSDLLLTFSRAQAQASRNG